MPDKWEYKVFKPTTTPYIEQLPAQLNMQLKKFGEDGWELIDVVLVLPTSFLGINEGTQGWLFFFKRKINN